MSLLVIHQRQRLHSILENILDFCIDVFVEPLNGNELEGLFQHRVDTNKMYGNASEEYECINDVIGKQPDTLTRAICSKNVANLKLVIDKIGLRVDQIRYQKYHLLRKPLHWAFFCHNVDALKLLVSYGCLPIDEENQEAVFLNLRYEKTFREACLILSCKMEFRSTWKSVDFNQNDDILLLTNLYNVLNKDEIIAFFEALFSIGFCLKVKNGFAKSEFTTCVCVWNIKHEIINYLLNRLIY